MQAELCHIRGTRLIICDFRLDDFRRHRAPLLAEPCHVMLPACTDQGKADQGKKQHRQQGVFRQRPPDLILYGPHPLTSNPRYRNT